MNNNKEVEEVLQEEYDEYVKSSKEIELMLEDELNTSNKRINTLEYELLITKEQLQKYQTQTTQSSHDTTQQLDKISVLEQQSKRLTSKLHNYENEIEQYEQNVRIDATTMQDLQNRCERFEEEIICNKIINDDRNGEYESEIQRLKQQLDELPSLQQQPPPTPQPLTNDTITTLQSQLDAQIKTNVAFLIRLQQVRGNICVIARIRPFTENEDNTQEPVCQALSKHEVGYFDQRSKIWKPFGFDHVFNDLTTQEMVQQEFIDLRLVESCVSGTNVGIIAYGQTSSGKTYTMDALYETMFQRLIELLVSSLSTTTPQIQIACIEIYNEKLIDLLASPENNTNNNKKTKIQYIPANDMATFKNIMNISKQKRTSSSTNLNDRSSRSHLIIIIQIDEGNLYLVDLAGSERIHKSGVQGVQLEEAKYINKSLCAFGDILEALDSSDKSRHIPFRNSLLTQVLQPALSPSSRTVMILTCPPTPSLSSETLYSLQFATRARRIELGGINGGGHNHNNNNNNTKNSNQIRYNHSYNFLQFYTIF